MNKIRVVHLSIGMQWGGAETLMAAIVGRLDPTRFEPQVIALQSDGPVGELLRKNGIHVTALQTTGGWDLRAAHRLKRCLAERKPDIVHAHLLRANLLACLTREDNAVIWHEHGTGEWLNPIMRLFERKLINRSSAIIAISNSVRDALATRAPQVADRIRVLPNAIVATRSALIPTTEKNILRKRLWGLGEEHSIVGYVGRLDDEFKGISFLLKSVAGMKAAKPQLRLILVGDGSDREKLKQNVRQLGIESVVIFTGSRADLDQIYPTFDILALPSLSEGFGMVLLEAMAHGLPVVASRVGGIPEIVMDQATGLLVPPADAHSLADALNELLDDPEKRNRMGKMGFERVRTQYELSNLIPKLETIYEDVYKMIQYKHHY